MGLGRILLAGACLLGAGCSGDDDARSSSRATTTTVSTTTTIGLTTPSTTPALTTSTTSATKVAGKTLAATTTTAASTAKTGNAAVTTSDAPRDPTLDRSDNNGSFHFGPNPTAASSRAETNPKDPLEFTISCGPNPDGHGNCHVELTNHVDRTAQFPGGLKITVTMRRSGGGTFEFPFDVPNVSSLAPGGKAIVDGTFDISEPGDYEYFATTTVHWP